MPVSDYSNGQYYDPASGQTVSPDEGTGMPSDGSGGAYKYSGIKYGNAKNQAWEAYREAQKRYQDLKSGKDSYAEAMARAKLGTAQQMMSAQAVSRGANPLGERAAIMGGGQAMRQGMVEASALRSQEMAQAQQQYQQVLAQSVAQQQAWAGMELNRQQAEASAYAQDRELDMAETESSQQTAAGYMQMGGQVAGAATGMMSDVRNKEAISPAGSDQDGRSAAEQDELMRRLKLYDYQYSQKYERQAAIPPEIRGQKRVGIMAQDLASSPIGEKAVNRTPQGMAIDGPQAVGLSLGLAGRLGQRADDTEARIAALEAQLAARRSG